MTAAVKAADGVRYNQAAKADDTCQSDRVGGKQCSDADEENGGFTGRDSEVECLLISQRQRVEHSGRESKEYSRDAIKLVIANMDGYLNNMEEEIVKTVKEIVIERYGSINNFIDKKLVELKGELPMSRQHLYQLIDHKIKNPGIQTLNMLSDMLGIKRENVYKEYSH